MKKVFDFGKRAVANSKIKNNRITIEVELKQTEKGEEFTACADVWNSKNTDVIMGGQCLDELTREKPRGSPVIAR